MTMMPVPVVPVVGTPSPMPVVPVVAMPSPMSVMTPVMVPVMAPAHLYGLDAIDFILCAHGCFRACGRCLHELWRRNRRQGGRLCASRERHSAGDQSNGETQKVSAPHDVLPFSNCFLEVMLEEVLQLEDECSLNRGLSLPAFKSSPPAM